MLLVLELTHEEVCYDMMCAHERCGLIEWRFVFGNTSTAISSFAQLPVSLSWLPDAMLFPHRERFDHITAGDVFRGLFHL